MCGRRPDISVFWQKRKNENKRRDGIYEGRKGKAKHRMTGAFARCCSPFKCNEQSDAMQCYVSYVKTEWMETEWKLFLFSMWMKNILFYKEIRRRRYCVAINFVFILEVLGVYVFIEIDVIMKYEYIQKEWQQHDI